MSRTGSPLMWRALCLALLPWPAVAAGLFVFHSAIAAFLLYHAMCGIGVWALHGPHPEEVGLGPALRRRHIAGIGALSTAAIVGGAALLGSLLFQPGKLWQSLTALGLSHAYFPVLALYFCLVNPIAEERFWRGAVLPALWRGGMNWRHALWLSSFLFAAWHTLPISLLIPLWAIAPTLAGITLVGVALGWQWRRSGSWFEAALLHALACDVPLIVVLWRLS